MNIRSKLAILSVYFSLSTCNVICEPSLSEPAQIHEAANSKQTFGDPSEMELRADKRYDEMLSKMQVAVEEVAQLYGDPVFLQVFTNDVEQASELKERLRIAKNLREIRQELEDLKRKRDELLSDIALKQREASKLSDKLIRQRNALDALASAFEQARVAVEDTAR